MRIDEFYGDHRPDQEDQSLCDLTDTIQYLMVDDETDALVCIGRSFMNGNASKKKFKFFG